LAENIPGGFIALQKKGILIIFTGHSPAEYMKKYSTLNSLMGWAVFLIASTVYIITSEPTLSYWDCGEYISTAYKLEVGHPPGAPLFQMIGRFFSLFAFGDVHLVARMVNTMSALASGFTILFLFWTITMIAKKIILNAGKELTEARTWMILGAGLVGSLAYTFTDSFWFSAVEGEVYGMSSFFTAIVFWAILKWEEKADEEHSSRWLVLIAYLVGLSIGVHLLNLLTIPAITLVYYFRKYPKPEWKGLITALIASLMILVLIMYVMIPWIVKLAGLSELLFVNSFGLPFNSGTIFYFVVLISLLVWGLIYSRKHRRIVLNTILLSFTFLLIGYTSFLMLVIRSNAETPINEDSPRNALGLLAYLNREQYGEWPLFYGPYFNAPLTGRENGSPSYFKDVRAGKYSIADKKENTVPVFDSRFMTIFPRMHKSIDRKYIDGYKKWARYEGVPVQVQNQDKTETINKPTFMENLRFFWNYQCGYMYFRYFMWNFAGRQNDVRGLGDKLSGNWKCGIKFIDEQRLGSQKIPELRKNRAENSFYFLPLILGLIGVFYHLKRDKAMTLVVGLLFFMTGLAIIIYLNQAFPEARERDYSYVGSFYAFAIWIGLGVLAMAEWLGKYIDGRLSVIGVTGICLVLVPGIMAQQGWDDHDRSGRYTSLAFAENYLNSCARGAILFTDADNETFPLWYAQEVEGIRTDVRVVNLSFLNAGWYIDQMKKKAYESDPVPFSLPPEKYRNGSHDVTYIMINEQMKDVYANLKDIFDILNTDDSKLKMNTADYGVLDYFPTNKFSVGFDSGMIRREKLIPEKFLNRMDTVHFRVDKEVVEKNELMVLDLLSANNWKRPVCFAMTLGQPLFPGLENYFHLEGIACRLLPVRAKQDSGETGEVNTDVMYDNVMNKFRWDNLNKPHTYIDEQNQYMIMSFRNVFSILAGALISEGKTDSARKVMNRCLEVIPETSSILYSDRIPLVGEFYRIGDVKKGDSLSENLFRLMDEDLAYLFSFSANDLKEMGPSAEGSLAIMQKLQEIVHTYHREILEKKISAEFQKYYNRYLNEVH
jgi:hypothetical protein